MSANNCAKLSASVARTTAVSREEGSTRPLTNDTQRANDHVHKQLSKLGYRKGRGECRQQLRFLVTAAKYQQIRSPTVCHEAQTPSLLLLTWQVSPSLYLSSIKCNGTQ
eukprot:GILJ01008493.1.p1 GENE.GILJ01008493.1~~GILJ01008493.1.p1  ORF type:complete len:109 (-),score=4.66 GILJ01008493.1:211-537(-)